MNTSTFAPVVINNYIWNEFKSIDPDFTDTYGDVVPFFPLYDNMAGDSKWSNRTYAVYDIMSTNRRSPFYVVKKSQLLYSIRGTVPDILYFRDIVSQIIDRGDDAGKDVNEWAGESVINNQVFFHSFETHEVNWSAEVTLAKDTRQPVTKDLIVSFDYHLARQHNDGLSAYVAPDLDTGNTLLYEHTQTVAKTTWVVNHNLGIKPGVHVFNASNVEVSPMGIHTNNNQILIYFTTPMTGSVRLF